MDFKRIGLMTIAAGLAITSFNACSQDEDLEGYVLNEGNGVSTLAKRSMGRSGESTNPPKPPVTSNTVGVFYMEPSFQFRWTEDQEGKIITKDTVLSAKVYVTVNRTYANGNPLMVSYTGKLTEEYCPIGLKITEPPSVANPVKDHLHITLEAFFKNSAPDYYNQDFVVSPN